VSVLASEVRAQDLFELEVFRYESAPAGGYEFSRAATTRHLIPEIDAHHLVFGEVHADVDARWQLSLGLGHCVTSSEPWLIKSVVGYRF
jgi:hypothetical protein